MASITYYTITYNANGGSGAPLKQTKKSGVSINLSEITPTRSNYTFKGWATSSSGLVVYSPGATYSANSSVTLYAVWTAVSYTVTYDANGGTGAPSSQAKTYGANLILSSTRPTKTNYTFEGWGVSEASTTVAYLPGSTYSTNASVALYAIWKGLSYSSAQISEFMIDRCISNGTLTDEGEYAKVLFKWETTNSVSSVKIEWKASNSSSWDTQYLSASGTSGQVDEIVGGGYLNTELAYEIRATVVDGSGSSVSETKAMSQMRYTMDFLYGGGGVSFGKPAEKRGLDIAMDVFIQGKKLIDFIYPVDSIYISYSHNSPADLFGGIWERMEDAFLLGCGTDETIGQRGGEKEHTLTSYEMPSHTHIQDAHEHFLPYTAASDGVQSAGSFVVNAATNSTNGKGYASNLATLKTTATNKNTGGDTAHNNMPPYIKVSIWRRTS